MSENAQEQNNKKFVRKEGRTLLVKAKEGSVINPTWFESLDGIIENGVSAPSKTNSYFITFTDSVKSLKAFKSLQKDHGDTIMIKFAHYRVFFTMEGLTDETDYNEIKKLHTDFVQTHTNSEVLYYKLYRNQKYLGCGDLTIDTKDALDILLSKDGNKEFDLGDGKTGTFYRYTRKGKTDDFQSATVETA
jgi:hypothetical protein